MKFFKPKYSVCTECGVHFEPVIGYEARWDNLCAMHRKPVMERDQKRDAVMVWAKANWESLVKMMEKDAQKQRAVQDALLKEFQQVPMTQQQNQASRMGLQNIVPGGIYPGGVL